ncbi:MAG: acyl-CoA dehydratase activase-related protein [Bacilli bacterium]|jgi:predicted CoA-substrate-specific enzyme activase
MGKEINQKNEILYLGIDVGSTTVKTVVLSSKKEILYSKYERHFSQVKEASLKQLIEVKKKFPNYSFKISITGSAGLGLAEASSLPFVQEVEGAFLAVKEFYPKTDVVIELGGEDAKIIFLTGGLEERMNGSCAGGTGAFIDQMSTLLDVTNATLDKMALKYNKIYPIASRCGVFAKSDIQPLLNQGADRNDVAMSIFHAIVDQTMSGLAQGREIKGNVLFLGGPLYFLKGLDMAFVDTLKLNREQAIFPKNAPIFMAIGASIFSEKQKEIFSIDEIINKIQNSKLSSSVVYGEPLFKDKKEYDDFLKEHNDFDVKYLPLETYKGNAYLGIDAGSTTTKVVLISEKNEILFSSYNTNKGQPIDTIVNELKQIYKKLNNDTKIIASAVTGYGESLIKASLNIDYGLVETVAHYKAASYFEPNVDFIIDIGGQDIKCFKIRNHAIDSIMLNEACSSGCGSFIQAFANALGYDVKDFAKLGLFAKHPVELGSRCTVFMNSSVKQAQKEGASIADISAGLSSSIIKNAIYKVIRFRSPDELGNNIVCQGGTFLNDAILRAFEKETGRKAIRPTIAGLMGAYGAALYSKEKGGSNSLITKDELENFSYKSLNSVCHGCTAHCNLTIITFSNKQHFISGNKCDRVEGKTISNDQLDLYTYKANNVFKLLDVASMPLAKVGIPRALSMYEQFPLWDKFFTKLGFEVVLSGESNRELYFKGQHTIPSDTVCYPAKLMHGHVEDLLDKNVDFIFYPSASYNIDEGNTDNHFNCPVVAYYGELLKKNNLRLNDDNFMDPFIDLNNLRKSSKTLKKTFKKYNLKESEIYNALKDGMEELNNYHKNIVCEATKIISEARAAKKPIIVLAGRPYHLDPEINHNINKLITSLGMAVISEDALAFYKNEKVKVNVLNQWTYHARLYKAANYVCENKDMELVQLISFGCGIDAVTSDEVRSILEKHDKFYTMIKIDEISNLGATRIRLRSLKAAIEEKASKHE